MKIPLSPGLLLLFVPLSVDLRVRLGYLRQRQLVEPRGCTASLALTRASVAEDSEWGGDLVTEGALQDRSRELFPLQLERK